MNEAKAFEQEPVHDQIVRHERRITRLEGGMEHLNHTVTAMSKEMTLNNKMTEEIKTNTEDLVSLAKGAKVIGKVIVWLGGISVAITGVATLLEFMKGH